MKERAVEGAGHRRFRGEIDAGRANVVAEMRTHIVRLDLADEGRLAAQSRDAHRRVGRRTAGNDRGTAHIGIERLGTHLVDEVHGALHDAVPEEEIVLRAGDDIDNGVAEREHVVALNHGFLDPVGDGCGMDAARLAPRAACVKSAASGPGIAGTARAFPCPVEQCGDGGEIVAV